MKSHVTDMVCSWENAEQRLAAFMVSTIIFWVLERLLT